MKYKKIYIFVFLFTLTIYSQEKKGIVNYGYIKSLVYGQKQGQEFNAQLIFDNTKSYFVSEKDSLESNLETLNEPKYTEANSEKGTNSSIDLRGSGTNIVGNQIYYDREKDSIWSYILGMGSVYLKEKRPVIDWEFDKETKKIGTFNCNKATASFRGREYTVWFTTKIPIPYGPWKLNGLPGLVLEGYDSEYKIYFYFKNIEYPIKTSIKIDFIKEDPEEKFIKWFPYEAYLKHANLIIEKQYERLILVSKEHPMLIPTKQKIENQRIEIAE